MVDVLYGESWWKHWEDDGVTVLTGRVDPDDIGICQINLRYWGEEAKRLGLDLWDIEDNMTMCRHIFDTQGITAWVYYNNHLATSN